MSFERGAGVGDFRVVQRTEADPVDLTRRRARRDDCAFAVGQGALGNLFGVLNMQIGLRELRERAHLNAARAETVPARGF